MKSLRPHLRMLSGDYPSYSNIAHDRGLEGHCRLCQQISPHYLPSEDTMHILTRCLATADTRQRLIPDLFNTLSQFAPNHIFLTLTPSHDSLTQFILDCTSLNLSNSARIPSSHPGYKNITRQCSEIVHAIHMDRSRQLKVLGLLR